MFDFPLSREGRYPRPSHSFIRALAWWFVAWLTLAVWGGHRHGGHPRRAGAVLVKLRPDDSGRPLWSREEAERIWRDNQPKDEPEPEDAA